MKKKLTISFTWLVAILMISGTYLYAQEQRASPPKVSKASVKGNDVTINYSSPYKKGREIFGGLVPYDKVWRTGANEATTIELSKDAKVGGIDVKAGKYALFTIPGESEWTIIINSNAGQWGAYDYSESQDIGRFKVSAKSLDEEAESFTIDVNNGGIVSLRWDKTKVDFKIQ